MKKYKTEFKLEVVRSFLAAGLARSTFYYQCQASQRADQQSALEARIRTIYDEHKGRYGYRLRHTA